MAQAPAAGALFREPFYVFWRRCLNVILSPPKRAIQSAACLMRRRLRGLFVWAYQVLGRPPGAGYGHGGKRGLDTGREQSAISVQRRELLTLALTLRIIMMLARQKRGWQEFEERECDTDGGGRKDALLGTSADWGTERNRPKKVYFMNFAGLCP